MRRISSFITQCTFYKICIGLSNQREELLSEPKLWEFSYCFAYLNRNVQHLSSNLNSRDSWDTKGQCSQCGWIKMVQQHVLYIMKYHNGIIRDFSTC